MKMLHIPHDIAVAEGAGEALLENLQELEGASPRDLAEHMKNFVTTYGPKILWAVVVFVIGFIIIHVLLRITKKILKRTKADAIVHTFILSILRILLYMLLAIICLSLLNMPITPIITALGAVGLAISLALKDSLSNIAGGIAILWSRPFSRKDYVEIKGMTGIVTEIGLVYTEMLTEDNKKILLPNGDVSKAAIVNYSTQPIRRLDLTFALSDLEFDKAIETIKGVVSLNTQVMQEPKPVIRLGDQTATAAIIDCNVWVKNEIYQDARYTLQEDIRRALSAFQPDTKGA